MIVQLCEYIKNHWAVHIKYVSYTACELCHYKTIFKETFWPLQTVHVHEASYLD